MSLISLAISMIPAVASVLLITPHFSKLYLKGKYSVGWFSLNLSHEKSKVLVPISCPIKWAFAKSPRNGAVSTDELRHCYGDAMGLVDGSEDEDGYGYYFPHMGDPRKWLV